MVNVRSEIVSNPLKVSTFGGSLEKNEKPHEAAIREFREETNYKGYIKIVYVNKTKTGVLDYYTFIGFTKNKVIPEINEESVGYKYLTYEDIMNRDDLHESFKLFLSKNKTKIQEVIKKYSNSL